tara:strand:+ start:57 stop:278 length:222 start_codon:yes stop_codon:yes gene_type:complete
MMQHYSEYIPGKTVIFKGWTDEQINWGNCDAPYHLILGRTYVIEDVEVHSQHTKVKLKNKTGWFNSVHFEVSN